MLSKIDALQNRQLLPGGIGWASKILSGPDRNTYSPCAGDQIPKNMTIEPCPWPEQFLVHAFMCVIVYFYCGSGWWEAYAIVLYMIRLTFLDSGFLKKKILVFTRFLSGLKFSKIILGWSWILTNFFDSKTATTLLVNRVLPSIGSKRCGTDDETFFDSKTTTTPLFNRVLSGIGSKRYGTDDACFCFLQIKYTRLEHCILRWCVFRYDIFKDIFI